MARKDRYHQEKQLLVIKDDSKPVFVAKEESPKVVNRSISFDDWWSTAEFKYSLKSSLKEPIRKHFETRGFMQSGEFDNGIKDFGL